MFTGALAASYYGTPRTTMDADIVVKVSETDADRLLLEPLRRAGFQVNERKVNRAFRSGYEIISFEDIRTSLTLDVILHRKKLSKKAGTILGLPTFYQTPEDLILSKLLMIKATIPRERAQKDKDDIQGILRQRRVSLKTIRKRAREQNTLVLFEELTSTT